MIPRLNISFPFRRQLQFWCGKEYKPHEGEYLLNHARTGIVMALRASLPNGGRVGVVAYNCHTVANAVVNAGCEPFFVDITDKLTIEVESVPEDLDAIVVTNLFGIRNDIAAIRKRLPKAIIIVDNAHGYGLPTEGDFTVYSINQGKFPALGCGGLLVINLKSAIINHKSQIDAMYELLPAYNVLGQVKLFCYMLIKAIAYSRLCYWLVMRMKKSAKTEVQEKVTMRKMAPGIRRLYNAWLPSAEKEIKMQRQKAEEIEGAIVSDNGFMAIVRTDDPEELKKEYAKRGIETATHFSRSIKWARQFGYVEGSCTKAEELTTKLLMIPTYRAI